MQTDQRAAIDELLRQQIEPGRYDLWFAEGKVSWNTQDDALIVGAANKFLCDWLRQQYQGVLMQVAGGVGLRRVLFRIDPALFQAQRREEHNARRVSPGPAAKPPPLLSADSIEVLCRGVRSDPDGHRLSFWQIPIRKEYVVFFLEALEWLFRHYTPEQHAYHLCPGPKCRRCPEQRFKCGYAEAIRFAHDRHAGTRSVERGIQTFPESALEALEQHNPLRGLGVRFYRPGKSGAVEVRIVEGADVSGLPEPYPLRRILMRRFNLSAWPDYETPLFDGEP